MRRGAHQEPALPRSLLDRSPDGLCGRERPSGRRVDEVEAVEEPPPAQLPGDHLAQGRVTHKTLKVRRFQMLIATKASFSGLGAARPG